MKKIKEQETFLMDLLINRSKRQEITFKDEEVERVLIANQLNENLRQASTYYFRKLFNFTNESLHKV